MNGSGPVGHELHAGDVMEFTKSDLVKALKRLFPNMPDGVVSGEVTRFLESGCHLDEQGRQIDEADILSMLAHNLLQKTENACSGSCGGACAGGCGDTTGSKAQSSYDSILGNLMRNCVSTVSTQFRCLLHLNRSICRTGDSVDDVIYVGSSASSLSPPNAPPPPEFDCGCCLSSVDSSLQVLCDEGHTFCQPCVSRYVDSVVNGEGSTSFKCMSTEGCDAGFNRASLQFIEPKRLERLEARRQNEDVTSALAFASNDERLHQCPYCEFKCLIPESNKVFECHNPKCMKDSCKLCKKDWAEHFGLPCDQVEVRNESELRTRTEEAMTQAVMRRCLNCSTPFVKEDGTCELLWIPVIIL